MNIGQAGNQSDSYLLSILDNALQSTGSVSNSTSASSSAATTSATASDNSQLSPFAQLLNVLQQLQELDPNKYKQVTQQIGTSLQTAAQQAQANGDTTSANQLNQLATDFTNASTSGQLPNIQDLAQSLGGHHHHGHGGGNDLDQLLSSSQTSSTNGQSTNPLAIIFNALQHAGVNSSGS